MEKLIKIQNELKVPKGNINKFGNYKYRSAEDILEAVKPLLTKHNAFVFLTDEIVEIGGKIFLKSTANFDGIIQVSGYAETSEHKGMSAEQTTGTASSYARKYALNGLFLIDETESDADSQKPQPKESIPPPPSPPQPREIKEGAISPTVWLTEEQFNKAMKSDKAGILATLKAYNGQNGKSMKSEYLEQLTKELGK